MRKMEYLMVSAIGVAPMLTAAFLVLNFYVHRSEKKLVVKIGEIEYKALISTSTLKEFPVIPILNCAPYTRTMLP